MPLIYKRNKHQKLNQNYSKSPINPKHLKENFFFLNDFSHQSTIVPDIIVLRIMSRRAGGRRDVHDSVSGWKLRRPPSGGEDVLEKTGHEGVTTFVSGGDGVSRM